MVPIGFACAWGADRERTWSGTPWRLRQALAARIDLSDLDVTLPSPVGRALRLAYVRRDGGHWRSLWAQGRPAKLLTDRALRAKVAAEPVSAVLEIGDLGRTPVPYYVLQDLSYDLLLEHFGERGVPHFRNLSRRQIHWLRDRQLAVYADAAGVLPMSRWLADRCVADGVDPAKVRVINPGVNAPLDPGAALVQRRQTEVRKLLFIGRDFDTKGGDQLVAAFALLRGEFGPKITLTIAGPKAWPLPGAVPEGIDYLGPVPVERVQQLYDSHDLFVMPSRFEGFGIAFVEALTRGLPCIGRDACAMPEIISAESGGRLVRGDEPQALAELIAETLTDDDLYYQCGLAAPERRAHYTWDRAAAEVLAALGLTD